METGRGCSARTSVSPGGFLAAALTDRTARAGRSTCRWREPLTHQLCSVEKTASNRRTHAIATPHLWSGRSKTYRTTSMAIEANRVASFVGHRFHRGFYEILDFETGRLSAAAGASTELQSG